MSSAVSVQTVPTVLVTGAGKRLGRAIALGLAAAGWRVAVHFRESLTQAQETASACAQLCAGAQCFAADLADEAQTRALLPAVIDSMGHVDALVNSAALFEHDSADSFAYTTLQKHMQVNTAAAIVLAQQLHVHMTARQSTGAVVNMLDQKLWNLSPDFFSYTLSKAALETANTLLAKALSPALRVIGIAPGLTLTSHMLSDEKFEQLHTLSPLGRSSSVDDVVATVLFALSNRSITGTTLLVDGGQHLIPFERDFSLM
ncbi:MAG: SDR family oxidoreductase [Limnohabitans sp.]|nr:SDR family oxidoreductase [Limnohabitans sp.]